MHGNSQKYDTIMDKEKAKKIQLFLDYLRVVILIIFIIVLFLTF